MKFVLAVLISSLSFSAMAICCKGLVPAPWNGSGSASQSECLAHGNVYVQGNSCNGNAAGTRDLCPDGTSPLFTILSPELQKRCLSVSGVIIISNPSRLKICCFRK